MQTPFTKLQDSKATVTTAGQRVQLNPVSTPCGKLTVTALEGNAGEIVYGGATVVAALGATRSGTPLVQGQSVDIPIDDLSKVWLDAVNSGDGVSYTWLS
jgi:hypothetical protein